MGAGLWLCSQSKPVLHRRVTCTSGPLLHTGITWTAGAVYSTEELADWEKRADQARAVEAERLRKLRDDPELPLVWMDVALRGKKLGRIEMVLFVKEAPRAAENLRQLCSGELRLLRITEILCIGRQAWAITGARNV